MSRIQHIPFDPQGGYEQWQLLDDDGQVIQSYMSKARGDLALAAHVAGQPLPPPVFPEVGHGLPTCTYCGVPMSRGVCRGCG